MPLKTRLFTPGPVEIPPRILRALSQVPPHHRTDVFRETLRRVTAKLRDLHGTSGEVFLFAGSGTSAMEAAVVNVVGPGEKSLAIAGGKFGERWAKLLEAYGQAFESLEIEWGQSVDPSEVERRLAADPTIRIVFATHSETSTGALHDVEALARITRPRRVRLVVDAVTSLGVHPVSQDAWGVDVMVCGSQKGLMLPPGIGTVSLAPWAADVIEASRLPRFSLDLRKARKSAPLGETAFTPPVSLVLALEESLAMMDEEGLEHVHERHRNVAAVMREGAVRLGFQPFAPAPSNAVTALLPPARVPVADVVKRLRDTHGMVVAGGQDRLKGRILRVGHMGAYDVADIHGLLGAMAECVAALSPRGAAALSPGVPA